MMVGNVSRLDNSASNWMKSAAALRMMTFTGGANSLACEEKLQGDMLNSKLEYKASELMFDSAKRAQTANFKRTLDLFG